MPKKEKSIISEVIRRFYHDEYNDGENQQVYNKFIQWLLRKEDSEEVEQELIKFWAEQNIKPDKAVLDALDRSRRKRGLTFASDNRNRKNRVSLSRILPRIAVVLLPLVFIAGIYLLADRKGFFDYKETYAELFVPNAESKELALVDGTKIWVNSGSALTYPEKMKGDERAVTLTGESFFSVAKDENKPFIVKTKHLEIKVLGTEFNVEAYSEESLTRVTLSSGEIDVNTEDNKTTKLRPGQQLVYNNITGEMVINNLDKLALADVCGWREGRLILESMTVPQMLSSIKRQYGVEIESDSLANFAGIYSAKFVQRESLDNVMSVIQGIVPGLGYQIVDDKLIIFKQE